MSYILLIVLTTVFLPIATPFTFDHGFQMRTSLSSTSLEQTDADTSALSKQQQIHHALDLIIRSKAERYFPDIPVDEVADSKRQPLIDEPEEERFLTFTLDEHKPLGCTAEESIVTVEDGAKHVFVSKVTEGGNAEKAGINVGDVIVGVSGSFDDVVEVVGSGLDQVRSLVGGRQPSMNLILKVIRNTNVQSEHEKALVDLCILPEGEGPDANVSKCIEALYQSDYEIDDSEGQANCDDADTECMLDTMLGAWGEELNVMEGVGEVVEQKEEGKKVKKPAPWSSRSSGSGTYVRDPKTGKMVNLDDQ